MTADNQKESQALLYKAWLRYTLYCGAAGAAAGAFGYLVWGFEAPVDQSILGFLYYHITNISWGRFYSFLLAMHVEFEVNSYYGSLPYSVLRMFIVTAGHGLVALIVGFAFSPLYMCLRLSLSPSYRGKFEAL